MNELLGALSPEAIVLDLGAGRTGSFDSTAVPFAVVHVDLECEGARASRFVRADAARLPFKAESFDVVISNHSLEHIDDLPGSLREIRRVLKSSGSLYTAVPDASTLTDKFYRWLASGGGHVNPFVSARDLSQKVERATGLKHVATRTLCTSLAFLNRRNRRTRAPRKLYLFGGGTQTSLLLFTYLFRLADRFLHTRLSVYGWALYFGNIDARIDCETWTNVCVFCGSGHSSEWLQHHELVKRWVFRFYRCPVCGTVNLFTDDKYYLHLGCQH